MRRFIIPIVAAVIASQFAFAQMPVLSSGTLQRYENFSSRYVTARHVDVWLPEGYTNTRRYAVLYMHDGQMLFDSATTWNKAAWDVEDVMAKLTAAGHIKDVLVVAIWNGGKTRHPDYFPQKPFESLTPSEKDTVNAQLQRAGRTKDVFAPQSDGYLKFIVEELKPFIDAHFSTATDAANTFIAGSSMGGLISCYAFCEYPDVFGGAACLSTHWPGVWSLVNNPVPNAFLQYLQNHLPPPGTHKIYFDCGDQELDALYPAIQKKVDEILEAKGYTEKNWRTQYFPGQGHNEKAWSQRLHIPLYFLLKK
jgi:enterochelin esterase-like enzyme